MTEKRDDFKKTLVRTLAQKGHKITRQRLALLDFFMKEGRHLSPQEIYIAIRKRYPNYGWATVYRTLKLLREERLLSSVNLGDKTIRYEKQNLQSHHDHLICSRCGAVVEFYDEKLEKLQTAIARRYKFQPVNHLLEIYGLCKKCKRKDTE